jgi:hypothetical protein
MRPAYQDRVIAEHAELTERIEKLSAFLTSKRASSEVEHRLLLLQRLAQLMYQAILAERIAMWDDGQSRIVTDLDSHAEVRSAEGGTV